MINEHVESDVLMFGVQECSPDLSPKSRGVVLQVLLERSPGDVDLVTNFFKRAIGYRIH